MKAAILAAGARTLQRPAQASDQQLPMALVAVAGVPILRRTITSLLRAGFDQFVIGTGYREEMIRDAVATWFPGLDVTFVTNPEFKTTSTASTLLLLRDHVDRESFMLLDGDVVFDLGVVEELIERGPSSVAVRSVGELGLEEVKVTADIEDRVLAIGKHVPVRSAMGESIGIALFSAATSRKLFDALDARVRAQGLVHEYYEAAFQQIVDEGATLYGVDIGSMYATEIDTFEDLAAADSRLRHQPAFDIRVEGVRLAV
jgi:choline kinase